MLFKKKNDAVIQSEIPDDDVVLTSADLTDDPNDIVKEESKGKVGKFSHRKKKKKLSIEDSIRETNSDELDEIPREDILIKDEEKEKWNSMSKAEQRAYKKARKRERRKAFIDRFNWAMLRKEIESYGYHYSFRDIMFQMLRYFVVVGVICYVLQLKFIYIFMLALMVFVSIPIIVRAQYQQMYEIQRFQMVTSYLDNVIPIFKNTPIITHAWNEVVDLVDGEMHEAVLEALRYTHENTTDENPIETACAMIEQHFPNSRIHAVHKMMLTVMRQNSQTYQASVDNVFYDVASWITRTFQFQKELEDKKQKMLLLCAVTLGADCLFIAVYSTNEIFKDFPKMTGYQISTFLFVGVLLLMMILFFVKMNGKWLVDDQTANMTKRYEKAFNYMVSHEKKQGATMQQKILAGIFVILGIVMYVTQQNVIFLVVFGAIAYMMLTTNSRAYKNNRKRVQKAIEMEFPIWLRDVALNLNNMTVLNAIDNSRQMASPILNYYIGRFLDKSVQDPSSIRPYNEFLDEYALPDVKTAMKALFTMQELDESQKQEQTNSLIIRNQEQLAKAERMRNDESVSGVTKFGFVPVGVFMIQMLISMVLMFMFMMGYMSQTMAGIGL